MTDRITSPLVSSCELVLSEGAEWSCPRSTWHVGHISCHLTCGPFNVTDPAGNSNVEESLRSTLGPAYATGVFYRITLRTSSWISKRDLQNTQTAPLAAVCTPTIKLVHRTTKD